MLILNLLSAKLKIETISGKMTITFKILLKILIYIYAFKWQNPPYKHHLNPSLKLNSCCFDYQVYFCTKFKEEIVVYY